MRGVNELLELFVDNPELYLVSLEAVIDIGCHLLQPIRHVLQRVKLLYLQHGIVASTQNDT